MYLRGSSLGVLFSRGRQGANDHSQHNRQVVLHGPVVPDVIAMLAIGGKSSKHLKGATEQVLVACLCALRHTGRYTGDVVLLTDDPEAFRDTALTELYHVKLVHYEESVDDVWSVFYIKCQLLDLLPGRYKTVMYMDSDIVVTAPLDEFWQSVPVLSEGHIAIFNSNTVRRGHPEPDIEYHGGLIVMERGSSESCLKGWGERMQRDVDSSHAVLDDQIAMKSAVEELGFCNSYFLPDHFMKFMSDWWSLVFKGPTAFSHFTRHSRKHLKSWAQAPWRRYAIDLNVDAQCLSEVRAAYVE
jgi:hypothetical protein